MRFVAFTLLIACSANAPPAPSTGSGSTPPEPVKSVEPVVKPPYAGPAERGPCNDAHECKLRSNCGCSCEGVALGAPAITACDKSCNNPDVCKDHRLICDLGSQTCSAIPPSP